MILRCGWCNKFMGYKEPMDNTKVSHGICPRCYQKVMKEMGEKNKERNRAKLNK